MKSSRRVVMLVAIVVFCVVAQAAVAQKIATPTIALDTEVTGTVPVGAGWQGTSFRLEIPGDVFAVSIRLSNAQADLDLVLSDSGGEMLTYSELLDFNETLFVSRIGDPTLYTGRYRLDVTYQYDRPPYYNGEELDEIPFSLIVNAVRLDPGASIESGGQVTGTLDPERAMSALYSTEVTSRQSVLRIDISDTSADLDIFLYFEDMEDEPVMVAETLRSTEMMVIDRSSSPPLQMGTYYILVTDQVSDDHAADFRLSISADHEAPSHLGRLPTIPNPSDPLERALLATVEVVTGMSGGGSGCVLTASGYLVTNWHVVAGPDGTPETDLTVALSLDHTHPPTELFSAEVLEYDQERDLALLSITGDRYGRPLENRINLPHFELRSDDVSIGDRLLFIGYPWVGGTGSRASVTLTSGLVSGFQQNSYGVSIKSDGEINSGNSGGSAMDEQFRLVGIPSSVVGEDAGQLAYIVPVSAIPREWLSIMGIGR
jgi:S1-C subfamily serine protease